jgi:hypothetical protein
MPKKKVKKGGGGGAGHRVDSKFKPVKENKNGTGPMIGHLTIHYSKSAMVLLGPIRSYL